MKKVRIFLILSIILGSLLLSGCFNKEAVPEKIYQVLENVVEKEKIFEEQQEPLVKLEKQEKEKYDQIMALGMKQHDEVVKLSDEALLLIEQREELFQKESDSLKASKKEFSKVEELKEELNDPEQKNKADKLYDIMMERFRAHEDLSKEYLNALKNDKDLYVMLKNEEIEYEVLEEHVMKLNDTYAKVLEANEEFNKQTALYNKAKLEFYKESGLKLEKSA